jgi:Cu-processing system permease protein
MRQVAIVAAKELRDGLRNRWVLAVALLLAVFALTLCFLGAAPTGVVKVSPLGVTIVSLSSLTVFLLPLIALLLSYDAIVGEIDRGTMGLLLAYPVARWQVVLGKFFGHCAVLALATVAGYGAAGLMLGLSGGGDAETWRAFAMLVGTAVLLGAVFVALGYLVSATVRDRGTAGGIAIGIWLFFVLVYDMALLGVLVAGQGQGIAAGMLSWLLLANPTDAFRLFNLAGTPGVASLSGLSGLAAQVQLRPSAMAVALVLWVLAPLAGAVAVFSRRQL